MSRLAPLLLALRPRMHNLARRRALLAAAAVRVVHAPYYAGSRFRKTEASCLQMQLADPPVKSVVVRLSDDGRMRAHFADVDGVRMGPVLEAVLHFSRDDRFVDPERRNVIEIEFYGDSDGGFVKWL
ncbi:hypothetical protein EJ06DRAFT_522304 [Trichodelitschia bisporula]|uniref:Uncharacterized protein n=1 Tax=Trichodelitschia bisporula TaxID=703511 RepID=A0A6G1HTW3_9PEZI|nr:hypothetical protein EJ06DRAFT_522304 [Trichodelitschia bisporula]